MYAQNEFGPHTSTSKTTPSPFVISCSSEFNTSEYSCYNPFGDSPGNRQWTTGSGPTGWLELDIGSGNSKVLGSYMFSVPTTLRGPNSWTMEGSNDDSTWDVLDTVTGQSGWIAQLEARYFICSVTTTAYRYFRINVSANNGDGLMGITLMWLIEFIPSGGGGGMLVNPGMSGGMRG